MSDYSDLSDAELIKKAATLTSNLEIEECNNELQRRSTLKRAEQEKQREKDEIRREQRRLYLLTPEGIAETKAEKEKQEAYSRKLEADRIAAKKLNAEIAEKERLNRLAEYERQKELAELYDEKELADIKQREEITGEKFYPPKREKVYKRMTGPIETIDKHLSDIDLVQKNGPGYEAKRSLYRRLREKAQIGELLDEKENHFMGVFENRFPNNDTTINNSNTNNTQIIPSGTNQNDITATALQEGSALVKQALKFFESGFTSLVKVNELQAKELENSRSHIRHLEKRRDKHDEKMEQLRNDKGKAEIKLLKLRKSYLKKHPIVAITEGLSKGVEAITDVVKNMNATPEQKISMENDRIAKKAARKFAENAEFERLIEERAQVLARKMVQEKG